MLDVDTIEARAAAATPGPWKREPDDDEGPVLCLWRESDFDFVKQAREDMLALIAEVRRLREIHEGSAAVDAFDAIAKLSGCKTWDYPGQVVRDVELLVKRLEAAETAKSDAFARGVLACMTRIRLGAEAAEREAANATTEAWRQSSREEVAVLRAVLKTLDREVLPDERVLVDPCRLDRLERIEAAVGRSLAYDDAFEAWAKTPSASERAPKLVALTVANNALRSNESVREAYESKEGA